jgi:hypothetical protein
VNFSSRVSFYFRGSGGEGVSEQWVVGVTLGSDAVEGPRVAAKAGVLGFSRSPARVVGKDGTDSDLGCAVLAHLVYLFRSLDETSNSRTTFRQLWKNQAGELARRANR